MAKDIKKIARKAYFNPDQTQLSIYEPRHFMKYKKAREEYNETL